jgi:hypothetical protein
LQMNETHILIRLLRMYVYSTELGIRLSFGKTSEFRGGGTPLPPSVRPWAYCSSSGGTVHRATGICHAFMLAGC